ncbi:MAG: glycosyltransferase family 2 protein [Chloroflexi bacterium]|nr:glycosyltransferase family 2 protein [Chloroflexota bacterium]
MKTVSIVVPALNEEAGLGATIQAIQRGELEKNGYQVQILVVDNGSEDGTAEVARQAGADVVYEPRRGYGWALKTGFSQAMGGILCTADADATYPVEEIPRLVAILEDEGLDFLTTNRFAFMEEDAMSFRNWVGNAILSLATRSLFGLKMRDPESGMWVFRKEVLGKARTASNSWPFSHEIKLEVCYFNKCRWREVPIQYRNRIGSTKQSSGWKVGFTDLLHITKKRIWR